MADTDDDDKGAGGTGDGNGGGGGGNVDESAVRRIVSDVLGGLFTSGRADVTDKDDQDKGGRGRGRGRGRDDDAGDIQSQVEAAVKKVRDKDTRDAAEKSREERLAAVEAKLAKPEKTPKQQRRSTRFMWGAEDED